jgi:hypothetical protein
MADLEDKVKDLKVEDGPPPKPHPEVGWMFYEYSVQEA